MKIANQKFTSIKNDFCLVFDKQGDITEVPDNESIKSKGFSFLTLPEIKALERTMAVDVVGIVCKVDPMN